MLCWTFLFMNQAKYLKKEKTWQGKKTQTILAPPILISQSNHPRHKEKNKNENNSPMLSILYFVLYSIHITPSIHSCIIKKHQFKNLPFHTNQARHHYHRITSTSSVQSLTRPPTAVSRASNTISSLTRPIKAVSRAMTSQCWLSRLWVSPSWLCVHAEERNRRRRPRERPRRAKPVLASNFITTASVQSLTRPLTAVNCALNTIGSLTRPIKAVSRAMTRRCISEKRENQRGKPRRETERIYRGERDQC